MSSSSSPPKTKSRWYKKLGKLASPSSPKSPRGDQTPLSGLIPRSKKSGKTSLCDLLPNELLERIFIHYVDLPPDLPTGTHAIRGFDVSVIYPHLKPPSPLVLGRVCSRWRLVAHSTPSVWSRIHIYNPTPGDLQLLKLFIERSQSSLLDLYIGQTESLRLHTKRKELFRQILIIAFSHSARWRSVWLHFLDLDSQTTDSPALWEDQEFLNLESFRIELNSKEQDGLADLHQRLAASPVLDQVAMIPNAIFDLQDSVPDFPWYNLTSLYITAYSTTHAVLGILALCPGLERCFIQSLYRTTIYADQDPVFLPNLHTFYIQETPEYPEILKFLRMPILSSLTIGLKDTHHRIINVAETWRMIKAFSETSPLCRLTHFALLEKYNDPEKTTDGVMGLPIFEDLVYLELDSPPPPSALGELTLKDAGGEGNVLKKLQDLVIRQELYLTDPYMSKLAASRMEGVAGTPNCRVNVLPARTRREGHRVVL